MKCPDLLVLAIANSFRRILSVEQLVDGGLVTDKQLGILEERGWIRVARTSQHSFIMEASRPTINSAMDTRLLNVGFWLGLYIVLLSIA